MKANSVVTVLPNTNPPAACSRATSGASAAATDRSWIGEPMPVTRPRTSMMSFTPNGTPASSPEGAPASALPAACACARIMAGSIALNAWISGSTASAWSMQACAYSTRHWRPVLIASTSAGNGMRSGDRSGGPDARDEAAKVNAR